MRFVPKHLPKRHELVDMLAYDVPRRSWIAGLQRLGLDKNAIKAVVRRANYKRRRQRRIAQGKPVNSL